MRGTTSKYRSRGLWQLLLLLALLFILMISAFILTLMGADIYKKIAQDMESNFQRRIPLSYITGKIRGADEGGQASIQDKEGVEVLVLEENLEGIIYETWIYEWNGSLYEVLIEQGTPIDLKDGMSMIEIEGLKMQELQEGLFKFESADQAGGGLELVVSLRSKKEK